jgi:SAM-dependent methyltransferase
MDNPYLAALIELHAGLPRQGPGDARFTRQVLSRLPRLPERPRVADLGCGSGAATLVLASCLKVPITAVDISATFLDELMRRAELLRRSHLVRPVKADIGALSWPAASLDLIWSEGAAYHLTFAGAIQTWRPLLASGGLAVISELTLYDDPLPEEARAFWGAAYPSAGSETANTHHAKSAGYEVVGIDRLPQFAWWENYYGPLESRMEELHPGASPVMRCVIADTEAEIDLFRRFSSSYGYTFYSLRAV